jgi:hypothetical protein
MVSLRLGVWGEIHTFLLSRVYRWVMGSHQMISPVEKPMTTSMCVALLVTLFTSWHKQWALVKRILVRYSAWRQSV